MTWHIWFFDDTNKRHYTVITAEGAAHAISKIDGRVYKLELALEDQESIAGVDTE